MELSTRVWRLGSGGQGAESEDRRLWDMLRLRRFGETRKASRDTLVSRLCEMSEFGIQRLHLLSTILDTTRL